MFSDAFFKILFLVNMVVVTLVSVCYFNQVLFAVLSLFLPRKHWTDADALHRYAVIIPARNEEKVIAELLDSIRAQHYPQELLTVIVIADNCMDRTAAVAAGKGAIVMERFSQSESTKGQALHFASQGILSDERFKDIEGFFIFDADNILHPDFVLEMNKAFDRGCRAVTGYRSTKNYSDNWLSANSSLMFLREARQIHYCRASLGIGTYVSGTGYLIDRALLERMSQRPFRTLTEDVELSAMLSAEDEKIHFCPDAVFFDEQPTRFRDFIRQRMRWCKGNHQVFATQGRNLIRSFLRKPSLTKWGMLMHILPLPAFAFIWFVLYPLLGAGYALSMSLPFSILLKECLLFSVCNFVFPFLGTFFCGAVHFLEYYHEIDAGFWRKCKNALLYPIGMYFLFPITAAVLFVPVRWKKSEHKKSSRGQSRGT